MFFFRGQQAYSFNGVNDYGTLGSESHMDNIWDGGGSLAFWVNPVSTSATDRILAKGNSNGTSGNQWSIRWESNSGDLSLEIHHSGTRGLWAATNGTTTGTWTHWVVTYNSDSNLNVPVFYKNGVAETLVASSTPTGTRNTDAGATWQVGRSDSNQHYYDGALFDLRIYDDILTANECLYLAQKHGDAGSATDPGHDDLLWFTPCDDSGIEFPDLSPYRSAAGENNGVTAYDDETPFVFPKRYLTNPGMSGGING